MVVEGGGGDSGKFKVLVQGLKEIDSLQLVPWYAIVVSIVWGCSP